MSENISNKKEAEIDLLDLLRIIGRAISNGSKSLGRIFMRSLVYLFKKWIPLGISLLTGLIFSYFLSYTSDSFYTSDLVIRNNVLINADLITYLNRLQKYSNEANNTALMDALSISQEEYENILDISAYWIIDRGKDGSPDYVDYKNNHNLYDTVNVRMNDRVNIKVEIKNPRELAVLKERIIQYIQKDSFFQERNLIRLRQTEEMISRLSYDIKQLDSLQKIKYFEETKSRLPQNGGQMIFLQEQKTQLVYTEIYELYQRKNIYEIERDLYSEIVTVLNDFSFPAKRNNGTLFYAKIIIPALFSLTLLILILSTNRKKLHTIFKKYE